MTAVQIAGDSGDWPIDLPPTGRLPVFPEPRARTAINLELYDRVLAVEREKSAIGAPRLTWHASHHIPMADTNGYIHHKKRLTASTGRNSPTPATRHHWTSVRQ